jgi:hypothetical protein
MLSAFRALGPLRRGFILLILRAIAATVANAGVTTKRSYNPGGADIRPAEQRLTDALQTPPLAERNGQHCFAVSADNLDLAIIW